MSFICLWTPSALPPPALLRFEEVPAESELLQRLVAPLLTIAPRVTIGSKGVVWADARGLSAESLARDLIEVYHENGVEKVRAANSLVPVCSEVAALHGRGAFIAVPPGTERDYLA